MKPVNDCIRILIVKRLNKLRISSKGAHIALLQSCQHKKFDEGLKAELFYGMWIRSLIQSQVILYRKSWLSFSQPVLVYCLVWLFSHSRRYNTKSWYRAPYDEHRGSSASNSTAVWIHRGQNSQKLVWSLDLPERMKVFIWKTTSNHAPGLDWFVKIYSSLSTFIACANSPMKQSRISFFHGCVLVETLILR